MLALGVLDQHLGGVAGKAVGQDRDKGAALAAGQHGVDDAAAQNLPNKTFIVATDRGIFYKMQQLCPDKVFIEAPTAGNGAACSSCALFQLRRNLR